MQLMENIESIFFEKAKLIASFDEKKSLAKIDKNLSE